MSKIETIRVKATNDSPRGKVLKTRDGTVEVPSGETIEADILPLSDVEREFYKSHGVKITELKGKAAKKGGRGGMPLLDAHLKDDLDAKESALAEAARADQENSTDATRAAVADAKAAFDAAKAAAAASGGDGE